MDRIRSGALVRPVKNKTLLLDTGSVHTLERTDSCLVIESKVYQLNGDRLYYRVLVDGTVGWLRDCDIEEIEP